MASLAAQFTEAARSNGGSPEAVQKGKRSISTYETDEPGQGLKISPNTDTSMLSNGIPPKKKSADELTGPFEAAFRKHEEDDKVEEETVKKWREALSIAAGLAGYESEKTADGHEAPLVEKIVRMVVEEINIQPQDEDKRFVGIKSRANDIIKILDINSKDAKMVGIHGMGGLGKTTVAKAVYNKISRLFDFHSFISDIRKKCLVPDGLVKLQSQLMLASILYKNRDTKHWDEIMKRWSGLRDDEIYRTLRVSYDDLNSSDERSIFLDVACFFAGIDEDTAIYIWDACGFSSRLSIKALIEKSLIEIIDGKLELPNMLREMGRRIVGEELGTGPETQSRLWIKEEIISVLEQQKKTHIFVTVV
ncbi:hypothetical protein EJ110_NYTH43986 [Nymphaea thermarum]|nr:hypothetical protein EJ110_NYTH43986 [Nymphaea thermarum]